MSLHQYHVDFSQLSPSEKESLSERVDNAAFTGIQWEQGFQPGVFFVEENQDLNYLKIPACCHLRRIL